MVAKTDSHFAILTKEDFHEMMGKSEIEMLNHTTDFFMNLPYLKDRSRRQMDRMHFIFSRKDFHKGNIVFDIDDESNYVYIIEKGEYEVLTYTKIIF